MEPTKTITLKTSDREEPFVAEKSVAMEMVTLKNLFDEKDDSLVLTTVPLPEVSSKCLSLILTYIEKHLELKALNNEETRKAYNAEFVKPMSTEELLQLMLAVNYLDVKYLLDMLSTEVANRIKNQTVEYVRELFGIDGDFTPEEEAKLREQHKWAFENIDKDN